ncbi:MAG TPA: histidinol-phosphate transaminase [Jiangellaceae bacterium]|nr:histidinol-phosphate transaminase [Jiangellaceae bacterium]
MTAEHEYDDEDRAPVRLRPALNNLPRYTPGRPPAADTVERVFKASSNENPYPPLPGVLEAAVSAAAEMNRYPDMGSTLLIDALADRFDVPGSHLATGTGSVGVLQQVVQATAGEGDEVVYAWRSFEAYPIVVGIAGATPVQVPLDGTARHDMSAIGDAVTDRTRLVVVCSPNNPTGPVVRHDEMLALLRRVPPDVVVVIDEAYREFVTEPDAVDALPLYREHPNVCVLRTFSKAYGLAGLRVGFAIAQDEIASALRATAVPFGVSGIAQAAAVESLRREPEVLERVQALVVERDRVRTALLEQGWDVPESHANFVWLPLGERSAEFAQACASAGVTVRPYGHDGVRVTVAEPEANDVVLATAQAWR